MRYSTAVVLAILASAASAGGQAKRDADAVELVGTARDYFYKREYRSYYWREDFSFRLKDEKTGQTWRVISREPTPAYDWRMGTTYTGVKVDWKGAPRVKVVGVTGVDRIPPEFYGVKLDEPHVATSLVVWVETAPGRWQEYYVNNWFHPWGGRADPVIHRLYADKPAPYDVYGFIREQHAPFSSRAKELIAQHPSARMFHGLVKATKANGQGYEIDLLHLVGQDKQGAGMVLYGDPKGIPLLEKTK